MKEFVALRARMYAYRKIDKRRKDNLSKGIWERYKKVCDCRKP